MGTPYMAFGNDEIDSAPPLLDPVLCHICNKPHDIQPATPADGNDSTMSLQFIICESNGKTYLVGINGKDIRGRGSSGSVPGE